MYAMLGNIQFEFINSFTSFEEMHTASYAKHDVLAGKPRLQAMGNDLTVLNFSLQLHWKLGNPNLAYKDLIQAKEAQQALSLVFGSGQFIGWFVITQINSTAVIHDAHGRTAARELAIELNEFVGDPNNPLPTPAISNGQNPLLSIVPPSIRNQISKVANAIQTGMRIFHAVEKQIEAMRTLINHAKELKKNPANLMGLIADAIAIGKDSIINLGNLPVLDQWVDKLHGAADFMSYSSQAAHQLQNTVSILQNGYDSGDWGDWLDSATSALSSVTDSMINATPGAQSLTAWLAIRKDENE